MADTVIERSELKRCDLFTLTAASTAAKRPVEAMFKETTDLGRFHFVLDLSEVEFVSSAFLRVLISNLKTVHRFNRGDIYLAAMTPHVKDVLDLAGLLPLFKTFDTVAEAVGSW